MDYCDLSGAARIKGSFFDFFPAASFQKPLPFRASKKVEDIHSSLHKPKKHSLMNYSMKQYIFIRWPQKYRLQPERLFFALNGSLDRTLFFLQRKKYHFVIWPSIPDISLFWLLFWYYANEFFEIVYDVRQSQGTKVKYGFSKNGFSCLLNPYPPPPTSPESWKLSVARIAVTIC